MFYQMGFLTESFSADLAAERLFAGVRSKVNLDIALVQESTVADGASMYRFLLPK